MVYKYVGCSGLRCRYPRGIGDLPGKQYMIKTLTTIGTSKKLTVAGLVLFVCGAGMIIWTIGDRRNEKQLLNRHQQMLDARSEKLNKLLTREIDIHSLAEVVPDEDWQKQVHKYNRRRQIRELSFSGAVPCIGAGGTILAGQLLFWIASFLASGLSAFARKFADVCRRHRQETEDISHVKDYEQLGPETRQDEETPRIDDEPHANESQFEKYSEPAGTSVSQNFSRKHAICSENAASKPPPVSERKSLLKHPYDDDEKITVLYCEENPLELEGPAQPKSENCDPTILPFDRLAQDIGKNIISDYQENTQRIEDSIKTQTENLEKQVEEFKYMTQTVKEAAVEHSEPINNALEELTQQVSAIREYASSQQGRMEKLQDGYDWSIIRTFCLRVIRCIDNLENRIEQLAEQGAETTDLEDVRDDLVFALESSGVEQFEPEINSDYRQHQKFVEAVKDRNPAKKSGQKDKIARVLRRGYRYVIDEENVKVVRTARVKLFN